MRRWLRRATPEHLQWIYQRGIQRLVRLAPDALAELRDTGNLLRHALTVLAAAAYWGPPLLRVHRPALDADRPLHPRPAARPARLRHPRPRTPPRGGFAVPVTGRRRADHPANVQITASPRRPTREFTSASKVTASSSSSATGNTVAAVADRWRANSKRNRLDSCGSTLLNSSTLLNKFGTDLSLRNNGVRFTPSRHGGATATRHLAP